MAINKEGYLMSINPCNRFMLNTRLYLTQFVQQINDREVVWVMKVSAHNMELGYELNIY